MKHRLLGIAALASALILSSCTGAPSGVALINLRDTTANPATKDAIAAASITPQFVVAWVLWGTPTPTPPRVSNVTAEAQPATQVASVPSATAQQTSTLPPTATPAPTQAAASGTTNTSTGGHTGGNAQAGMSIFTGLGGCSACHDTTMGHTVVGPTLKGISKTAATRKEGVAAEDYIYESITSPNAYVVKGFSQGIMPQTFKSTLSSKQINDVIAYLMSLK